MTGKNNFGKKTDLLLNYEGFDKLLDNKTAISDEELLVEEGGNTPEIKTNKKLTYDEIQE